MAALAREVAERRASEFAYTFKGNAHHCSPESINHYVSLAHALGLLTDEQKPFADMRGALLQGFKLTISEKVKKFAESEGFDGTALADAVRRMIRRTPAQVPSLRNLHAALELKCGLQLFRRVVHMETFKAETEIKTGLRQVMLIPDIFEG